MSHKENAAATLGAEIEAMKMEMQYALARVRVFEKAVAPSVRTRPGERIPL